MSVCRICLCSRARRDLADLNLFENEGKQTYKEIILFCLEIQINEDLKISTRLCGKCYKKIIQFYQFKIVALKNDEQLRSSAILDREYRGKGDVKIEKSTGNGDSKTDLDEPMIVQVKDEDSFDFDLATNDSIEHQYEFKQEDNSDDEFLSVIAKLQNQAVKVAKESVQKKKRVKAKRKFPPGLTPEEIAAKRRKYKGIYEGICEHCGKVYKDLRSHVRLRHTQKDQKEKQTVSCEHCDKSFASNVLKQRHVQRKHLAIKEKCQLCDRSVADLKMHTRNVHEKDLLQFQCAHCDLKFLTQGRLNAHISVHTKDRPFACDQCSSCFRQKISLDNHRRQVHNKERSHLCQFCSKCFFKKHHLTIHLRSHTNEKPYQCPDCGKNYQTTTSLRNHRLTHGGEKKILCTLCDATFVTKSYLSNHMVSHIKEKRYPCQFCNAKFHRSDHRKRHEYTAHLKHTGVVDVPRSYKPRKRCRRVVRPKRTKMSFESDSSMSSDSQDTRDVNILDTKMIDHNLLDTSSLDSHCVNVKTISLDAI